MSRLISRVFVGLLYGSYGLPMKSSLEQFAHDADNQQALTRLSDLLFAVAPGARVSGSSRVGRPSMQELGRGSVVRIMRKESFWFRQTGTVASVSKGDDKYPVTVRFERGNYAGITTNNFGLDELIVVSGPPAKGGKKKGKKKR